MGNLETQIPRFSGSTKPEFWNFLKLFPEFSELWIHAALTFMPNEIRAINYSLAKYLYKSLRYKIDERRTVYSSLLNIIKNPYKWSDIDKDLDTTLIKSELKALILCFIKGPKKILYHSTSIIASQMRRTILPLLKSYLMPSKNVKAL